MRPSNYRQRRHVRGSFEEIPAKSWWFLVSIVTVLLVLGPPTIHAVRNALGSETNTVSSQYQSP